jgi:hypothetical protein
MVHRNADAGHDGNFVPLGVAMRRDLAPTAPGACLAVRARVCPHAARPPRGSRRPGFLGLRLRTSLRFLRYESAAEIQPAVPRLGFGQGPVLLPLARPEQMLDVLPADMQELCNQAPVATPPEGLRAHEAGSWLGQRSGERRLPPLRAHAGGIAAERGDAETAEAVLARLTGEAAAKLHRVPVGNAAFLEHRGESWLVELGIVTRARKASHIDERADTGLADNRHQLFRRPSPVPDRPDDHRDRVTGPIRSVRAEPPSPLQTTIVVTDDQCHGSGGHDHGRAEGVVIGG